MPRLPRYVLPGHPQHVIQRGKNRCPIFVAEEDYACFRRYLMEACTRHECRIHAYVFMTNHIRFSYKGYMQYLVDAFPLFVKDN